MSELLCTFDVGPLLVGIPVDSVQEVMRLPRTTPVPHADSSVIGITNLRGSILVVFDLRVRLGLGSETPPRYIAIVKVSETWVGLGVDRVRDVISPNEATKPRPKHLDDSHARLLPTMVQCGDKIAFLLDTTLLSADQPWAPHPTTVIHNNHGSAP